VDLLLEDSPNTLDPADTLVPVNFIPRASSGSTTT
jgi:hypothetical protein